jgi:DNA polymerase I-like protein with 3'-5' exonuclease and polymerase domains
VPDITTEELDDLFDGVPTAVAPTRAPTPPVATAPTASASNSDDGYGDSPSAAAFSQIGLQKESQRDSQDLSKPWMKFHSFNLVKSVDQVREIVDKALAHGSCGLDLETEGLDNRIEYDAEGKPYTKHKIVGYCISVKGVGYYIPVHHQYEAIYGQSDLNLPVAEVEAEIKRLCLASQPKLTEEGMQEDPFGSSKLAEPPRVVIYFWHSKFDQEFLYPVTGIDFWHPSSFEDGYLSVYTQWTDDNEKGLKDKAKQKLRVEDPEVKTPEGKPVIHVYEMIELDELFPPGTKRTDRNFAKLYPDEGSVEGRNSILYACSDAICTEILCEAKKVKWEHTQPDLKCTYENVISPSLKGSFGATYRLEKQATQAVRVLERTRAKIAKEAIVELLAEARKELEEFEVKIKLLAKQKGFNDFNPGSSAQLSEFLFGERGLDIKPKPKKNEASGQFKTDAGTLEAMVENNPNAPEVILWIVNYRQIDKIIGTYLENLKDNCDENDCLRFQFKQTGAATGRFTAPAGPPDHGYSGIPIQGIPARVDPKRPKVASSLRRMFVARTGYTLVKVDYAGQELRIVTNLSGEPVWIKEFLEGTGDLHTITAQAFFGAHITKANKTERNMGKVANFALIYGGGVQAIQRATKCDKVEAARRKANFDKSVPTFAKWVSGQHAKVRKDLGVSTAFGRFIRIPDANIKAGDTVNGAPVDEQEARRIRAGCERKSTNFPIQGSGADILKISLVRLVKEFTKRGWLKNGGDDSVRMIMTVHDEIVFEIQHDRLQEAMPVIVNIMESPSRLAGWKIPLIVEPLVSLTWDAKYDWNEIMEGKTPVPEWLVGHVTPGAAPVGDVPKDPQRGKVVAAPVEVEKDEPLPLEGDISIDDEEPEVSEAKPTTVAPVKAPTPQPVETQKGQVVTFTLPNSYVTRQSKRLIMKAVVGAIPLDPMESAVKRLRLLDSTGATLIDPKLGIRIEPELFSRELQEHNLGPGSYTLGND